MSLLEDILREDLSKEDLSVPLIAPSTTPISFEITAVEKRSKTSTETGEEKESVWVKMKTLQDCVQQGSDRIIKAGFPVVHFIHINTEEDSEGNLKVNDITRKELAALQQACGLTGSFSDLKRCEGQQVRAKVKFRPEKDGYPASNTFSLLPKVDVA